jgi:hypothetical protein
MIVFAGISVDGSQSVPDVWVLSNANGLGGLQTGRSYLQPARRPLDKLGTRPDMMLPTIS